jgi:putative hydrolase of the HAD superfamily
VDFDFWANYHRHLMQSLGVQDELILGELILLSRKSANWTVFASGVPELLQDLRNKYTLGVISNADGKLAQSLETLGLRKYFSSVTDSGVVGHEKPDAAIFQAALRSLKVFARESLYVGDIYSLDYSGARNAGMHALLMDVAGVYVGHPAVRIGSFAEFGSAILQIGAE